MKSQSVIGMNLFQGPPASLEQKKRRSKGGIYTEDLCPVCGGRFRSEEPKGMFCPAHRKEKPSRYKVQFRGVNRRFRKYAEAFNCLTALRSEYQAGDFDEQMHQIKDRSLQFDYLATAWLEVKKSHLRPAGHSSLTSLMQHASGVWRGRNIKTIDYLAVEKFVCELKLAPKTKFNVMGALKQLWKWAGHAYGVPQLPAWPSVGRIDMTFRKTVSLEKQEEIIRNIRLHEHYRVWLCVAWLATYIAIRPSEMLGLRECDIDRERGLLTVKDNKNPNRPVKSIPLTATDCELVRAFPEAADRELPFFRHDGRRGSAPAGMAYRRQMIWAAWKRACARVGVEGVDLYGGTKHSTAVGLRDKLGYEEVRKMTGHTTNKAFDRYIQLHGPALRGLFEVRGELLAKDS